MGCVNASGEHEATLQSPERVNPVLLGGSPASGRKTPRDVLLDDALETLPLDTTVTFCSYFRVSPEKREEWREHCRALHEQAETHRGCLFHRASFGADAVHLRETFADAAALLGHFQGGRDSFCALLELSVIERVEVHGPRTELDKVGREVESIGGCPCTLFELRPDSIRRASDERRGPECVVSLDHYFRISQRDLPMFKCYHCAAFSEMAGRALGLERHSVSFSSDGIAHLSEDFTDAEAALAHLQASSRSFLQAVQRSLAFCLEVHGPEKELQKLRGWLALISAKQIEDEDLDQLEEISGFQLAESRATPDRTAREAVAELLSKATFFDLGSRITIPCTTRSSEPATGRAQRKVSFADSMAEAEEPPVVQFHVDTAVSFAAHFRIEPGKLEAWKECCGDMSMAAAAQDDALQHSVSHSEGGAQVLAAFRDAVGLLMHLQECEETLQAMLDFSKVEHIEVHAPRAELAKVRRAGLLAAPLLSFLELAPDGLRSNRPHSGLPGSDSTVSLCYRFRVQECDLPLFKRMNCRSFCEMARTAPGLEHHSVSFGDGVVHLRQGFTDAHAALAHIRCFTSARLPALDSGAPPSLDVHGPEKEVDKILHWALSASSRAGQADEGASAAASLLGKASVYLLDGRAHRRTFVGRLPQAERRLAAGAAAPQPPPPPPLTEQAWVPPPPEEPLLPTSSPPPAQRSYSSVSAGDPANSSFAKRQAALEAALEAVAESQAHERNVAEMHKGGLSLALAVESKAEEEAAIAEWQAARRAEAGCAGALGGAACGGAGCVGASLWCRSGGA